MDEPRFIHSELKEGRTRRLHLTAAPRFAFAVLPKFDYCFCAPPSPSAAVGEPRRWAKE